MNFNLVGDPEITFESRYCPNCVKLNWSPSHVVKNGEHLLIEIFRCWNCNKHYSLGYVAKECEPTDEMNVFNAVPDPAIAKKHLEVVVDAALEQYDDMEFRVRKDDQELRELMQDIIDSINVVKKLISEPKIKK